ncbi:MAG: SLOG family protein [Hominenteromicrobium sp.]
MERRGCCFTGHRSIAAADREPLRRALETEIRTLAGRGISDFYAGGARGFDTLAAEAVLRVRETLPVRLHLILPCRDQCRGWPTGDRLRYEEILCAADSVRYICDAFEEDCMRRRNDALVAAASVCVCYLNHPRSGTGYTVRRAREAGLEIVRLMTTEPVQTALPGT